MQRLALRFGISDVAIAKRCRKLNIPVPGRGYWARKAAGQRVRVTALPKARDGEDSKPIVFAVHAPVEAPVEVREGPVWEQEQFEARPENRIVVHVQLSRESSNPDAPLPQPVARALHFLDAFVGACKKRGFAVEKRTRGQRAGKVTVRDQVIEFQLHEPQRRVDLLKESGKRLKPGEYFYPRWRFEDTGTLEFQVGHVYGIERRTWRDGKRQRIEECLNAIMVALVAGAVALNTQAEERKRAEVERIRLARLEHEETMQREGEEQRVQQLIADADGWMRAERLRRFADAIETDAIARSPGSLPIELSAWLAWVHYVADETDPTVFADPLAFLLREPPEPLPTWMRASSRA
jgi:hypothetical protein